MSDQQVIDNQKVVDALTEIRKSQEAHGEESGIFKAKFEEMEKVLGDTHEKQQAALEEKSAEHKAMKEEVAQVKKDYEELYKLQNRGGIGGSVEEQEAALYKRYSSELDSYLRKGLKPSDEALGDVAQNLVEKSMASREESVIAHQKSLVTGSNPDGGYLVFPDRRTDIQVNRIFETSPVRSVCRVITTTSNEAEIIINDQQFSSGGWVGENQSRGDTANAQFGVLSIATHEQFAQPKVTQKMLDDSSINIEALINEETSAIINRTENTAVVIGDGSAKPRGFLDYPAWAVNGTYERGAIEQIDSGAAGAVRADGIIDLQNALIQEYDANAVFFMKRATWGNVLKLKDGNGNYLLNLEMLPEGAGMMLLGKRVLFANDMPAVGADSLSIAYGDFGVGYTIVDRLGIRVLRDAFTDKPFIKFYTTKRVGGAVTNYEAIKIQKLSA